MVTVKEIAALAKVSSATVSRVLNRDETLSVSPEVRSQIMKIAQELKYIPPKMRHAQKSEQVVIGIADWHIIRSDRPNIRLETLDGFAREMMPAADIRFVRMTYQEQMEIQGIIAFGMFTDEEMEYLKEQSTAIVFVNSGQLDYQFDSIVMDYNQGLQNLLDYLLNQKEYRSIGYIGGVYEKDDIHIGFHRWHALRDMIQERNCLNEQYFCIGEISRESGYEQTCRLLDTGDVPEVLVLGSDEIAEGALAAIKEHKYRIPKDIAIVIYRDMDTLITHYPTYTSLQMLPDLVWTTAIKLLKEQIVDKRQDSMKIFLPTKLELGDSA